MCRAEPPVARWGPIGPDGPPRRDRFGPGPRGRRRHRWGVAELRPEALRAATGGTVGQVSRRSVGLPARDSSEGPRPGVGGVHHLMGTGQPESQREYRLSRLRRRRRLARGLGGNCNSRSEAAGGADKGCGQRVAVVGPVGELSGPLPSWAAGAAGRAVLAFEFAQPFRFLGTVRRSAFVFDLCSLCAYRIFDNHYTPPSGR